MQGKEQYVNSKLSLEQALQVGSKKGFQQSGKLVFGGGEWDWQFFISLIKENPIAFIGLQFYQYYSGATYGVDKQQIEAVLDELKKKMVEENVVEEEEEEEGDEETVLDEDYETDDEEEWW